MSLNKYRYFVVCNHINIKILYDDFLEDAVSLFCDGFSKYNCGLIDCTICLRISDKVLTDKEQIVRQLKNGVFECYICKSIAEYNKDEKRSSIFFSLEDLIGSSGKPNYNIVYFLITEVLTRLLIDQGFCAYHASSISLNGKAVVFMGESMSGKTTLSLKLASKGYCYLGDDRLFVRNGQVYSYPKPLHIAHDIRSMFETDYSCERKKGKSFIKFREYIKEKSIISNAKIACVFLISKEKIESHKTYIKNMRGILYGLNSLFYCEEELPLLLDSIIEMDEVPVYVLKNEYSDSQIEEMHKMIKNILLKSN